jgi:hypothetical protein
LIDIVRRSSAANYRLCSESELTLHHQVKHVEKAAQEYSLKNDKLDLENAVAEPGQLVFGLPPLHEFLPPKS